MLTVGEHHVFEWHQANNVQARTSDSFQLINTPLFYYLGLFVDIGVRRSPNQFLVVVFLRSDLEFSRNLSVDLVNADHTLWGEEGRQGMLRDSDGC